MQSAMDQIRYLTRHGVSVFGAGAAQMLPILAYHFESDLSELVAILDDNEGKVDHTYPGLTPKIRPFSSVEIDQAAFIVTALDSSRQIMPRLFKAGAQIVIHPLGYI
jgi:hypothetical protein